MQTREHRPKRDGPANILPLRWTLDRSPTLSSPYWCNRPTPRSLMATAFILPTGPSSPCVPRARRNTCCGSPEIQGSSRRLLCNVALGLCSNATNMSVCQRQIQASRWSHNRCSVSGVSGISISLRRMTHEAYLARRLTTMNEYA